MNFSDAEDVEPGRDLGDKRNLGIEAGLGHDVTEKPKGKGGSAERYRVRLPKFEVDGRPLPRLRHHALWLLHNCVAHPVLALSPSVPAIEFHELTSAWLNHVAPLTGPSGSLFMRTVKVRKPEIEKPVRWAVHNLLSHVAIGLLPCEATFKLHDVTASWMAVKGWV